LLNIYGQIATIWGIIYILDFQQPKYIRLAKIINKRALGRFGVDGRMDSKLDLQKEGAYFINLLQRGKALLFKDSQYFSLTLSVSFHQ